MRPGRLAALRQLVTFRVRAHARALLGARAGRALCVHLLCAQVQEDLHWPQFRFLELEHRRLPDRHEARRARQAAGHQQVPRHIPQHAGSRLSQANSKHRRPRALHRQRCSGLHRHPLIEHVPMLCTESVKYSENTLQCHQIRSRRIVRIHIPAADEFSEERRNLPPSATTSAHDVGRTSLVVRLSVS